ncbi:hypothetical protein NPIL_157101 [Nephila pilipes]|uniref:Uncharacterized protein n=1 Tax=Nephila pilipes TaxID=299642 RepID=A0A8X6TLK7_NEPPI|nr:hypothetical protein NPIL_157101 [Nephila pilipes]
MRSWNSLPCDVSQSPQGVIHDVLCGGRDGGAARQTAINSVAIPKFADFVSSSTVDAMKLSIPKCSTLSDPEFENPKNTKVIEPELLFQNNKDEKQNA